jgi:hypothetical protein
MSFSPSTSHIRFRQTTTIPRKVPTFRLFSLFVSLLKFGLIPGDWRQLTTLRYSDQRYDLLWLVSQSAKLNPAEQASWSRFWCGSAHRRYYCCSVATVALGA